ncbi:MAG: SdrD B-like domain-containing protein [Bacteroidales bacterium]
MKGKCIPFFFPGLMAMIMLTGISYNPTFASDIKTDVHISFLKHTRQQNVDKVASNVLKIVNNSSQDKELVLKYSIPNDWKMVGPDKKTIRVEKNDSVFIPVRTVPNPYAQGNSSYGIRASIHEKNLNIGSASYTVHIKKISNWSVDLRNRKVYFTKNKDSVSFDIHIKNQGNAIEKLSLRVKPDFALSLYGINMKPGEELSKQVTLGIGQDTVIRFSAFQVIRERKTQNRVYQKNETAKKSSIRIRIKEQGAASSSKIKAWNGGVHVYSMPSQHDVGESLHGYMPITIDWNTFNILQSNTYSYLNIHGSTLLKNQQSLAFNYQANFSNNYLNPKTYLGDYHYLGYKSRHWGVEVGNIGSPRNSYRLTGKGAKAFAGYKGHRINGIYVQRPELFGDNIMTTGYGGGYSYHDPHHRFKINTFAQEHFDNVRKINSRLGIINSDLKLGRSHYIKMELGGSQEVHKFNPDNVTALEGYSSKVNYRGALGRFRYNLKAYVGSDNYIKYRGIENYSGQLLYAFDQGYSLGASYNQLNYQPDLYSNGQLLETDVYTFRDIYQLRFSKTFPNASFIISPRYEKTNSALITSVKNGVNLDYRYRPDQNFIISSKAYMGYVDLPAYNMDKFFTGRLLINARFRYLSANVRYYYGPNLSREKIDFAETGENPQKFYANMYYDFWFAHDKFLLKTNVNYNYTTFNQRSFFSSRPELFFYTDAGFRISLYARYIMIDEYREAFTSASSKVYNPQHIHASNYEFGFGIRKNIFVPASFEKKSELTIIAFNDFSGNGIQDDNEPGLNNVLIRIQELKEDTILDEDRFARKKYETITNTDGRAIFTNLPGGTYEVKAKALELADEWFNVKTMIITVHKDRKLFIPLNKGGSIKGKLTARKADYSKFNNKIDLSDIRITAFQQEGVSHSTLTDENGEFTIYLPAGDFIISVNEAALGNKLKLIENNKKVNIPDNKKKIFFYVVEKQRKLNIKQFDNNGDPADAKDERQQDTIEPDTMPEETEDPPQKETGDQQDSSDIENDKQQDTIAPDTTSGETGYIPAEYFHEGSEVAALQIPKPENSLFRTVPGINNEHGLKMMYLIFSGHDKFCGFWPGSNKIGNVIWPPLID